MSPEPRGRRRPTLHITLARASRLHRLVRLLAAEPRARDAVLLELAIGLRTFYRELELLARCGIKTRVRNRAYALDATAPEAEGRLPFPDPQLSFAEMAELAGYPGPASQRLARLLESVTQPPVAPKRARGKARK